MTQVIYGDHILFIPFQDRAEEEMLVWKKESS
jgi:hypothetical protein